MRVEYTVTMTKVEKGKHAKTVNDVKDILAELAQNKETSEEKQAVWDLVRKFNEIAEIFN